MSDEIECPDDQCPKCGRYYYCDCDEEEEDEDG